MFCCALNRHELLQVLWAFSIYLEAIAILPQLFMLQRTKEGEAFTLLYIFCVGAYRGLYIINWIYRYITEPHYWQVRLNPSKTKATTQLCHHLGRSRWCM